MHIPSPLVKVFGQNTHKYLTAMNGLPLIGVCLETRDGLQGLTLPLVETPCVASPQEPKTLFQGNTHRTGSASFCQPCCGIFPRLTSSQERIFGSRLWPVHLVPDAVFQRSCHYSDFSFRINIFFAKFKGLLSEPIKNSQNVQNVPSWCGGNKNKHHDASTTGLV